MKDMHDVHLVGLDLNLLVALDALLAERHVTRAAARIGLSQSAMSHALGRIREAFDDPMLVRTSDGMLPTDRALALEPLLRRALGELSAALAGARASIPRPASAPSRSAPPTMPKSSSSRRCSSGSGWRRPASTSS